MYSLFIRQGTGAKALLSGKKIYVTCCFSFCPCFSRFFCLNHQDQNRTMPCKKWQTLGQVMTKKTKAKQQKTNQKKKRTPITFVHLLLLFLLRCVLMCVWVHVHTCLQGIRQIFRGWGHLPTHVGTVPFHWARALGTASHLMAVEPCSV